MRSKSKRITDLLSSASKPGGTAGNPFIVRKPLVVMFENEEGSITCHIHPQPDYGHEVYGLLVCDLVRHLANAFKVDEDEIWSWVERERHDPTAEITHAS
ncbi:MAG: hypothetical protein WAN75_49900 [Xanthobacteraceae bacterium]|jgi:hypothetical protein